jgi:hypothetical protein
MFSTKKNKFSKLPSNSFIDYVSKYEKKKIGPNHYKNTDPDNKCVT